MQPKMIVFDFGGTLAGSEGYHPSAAYAVLRPYLDDFPAERLKGLTERASALLKELRNATELEIPEAQLLRLLLAGEGIQLPPETDLDNLIYDFWMAMDPHACKEGIADTLRTLRARGIRLGVISNTALSGNVMGRWLNEALPDNGFEFVLTSCDYLYRKPHGALFRVAEKISGLTPAQCWYCGDTFGADIRGAAGAGWYPVWYNNANHAPPEDAADYRYLEISRWSELLDAPEIA